MILQFYRKQRIIAFSLAATILAQIITPTIAYALTSGPTQPEVQGFQPVGASEMVDLFTGDFSYNIPLFELPGPNGGYPFNLGYQAGIGMDQEASWVGLGWSLTPGAINRQMRGLPDEFKGDLVYTKMSVDPSVTVGLGAGAGLEVFGADSGGSLKVGFSVSNNNYNGLGFSIDGSIGYAGTGANSPGVGLDISLDSREGVGVSPSLTLGTKVGNFGLGVGYNSKSGLSSLSIDASQKISVESKKGKEDFSVGASSTLSLVHPGYTPQISMPMKGTNISITFKLGGAFQGVFASPYVTGFYNEQRLQNDKRRMPSEAFGYLNYQYATKPKALLDFNREKEGMVSREIPNLPIPSLSYDIYSVVGQGISAMYRPMRNDYGIIRDTETTSESTGVSGGVDVGIPAGHVGINYSVNHSKSTSGEWDDNNQLLERGKFQKQILNSSYEPWYFKVHGEPSSESVSAINKIGGEKAVRVKLAGSDEYPIATSNLENRVSSQPVPDNASTNRERKSRSQAIRSITNEQLLAGGEELVSYFKVSYLDHTGAEQIYNRTALPKHHMAGFTALTPEGMRYNYGIPAYNLYQEEVAFTARKQAGQVARVNVGDNGKGDPSYEVSDTEKFLKRTELPRYAHSFLLTSIIGPDYVDVTGDGVSADDLGYWVKFTYQKTTSETNPFKWRDPFSQAHFQEGWKTDPRDDKGSFVYGEKEIWYLAKAETKSHIATFTLQSRQDGLGVATKLQDTNETGNSLYALKEIKLFTRSAGQNFPIRKVRFEYDYSLCKKVFNNNSGNGKLTLQKVWFEYGSSNRGRFNPYEFSYSQSNPDYDLYAYDRWGNYKPYPVGNQIRNVDFPYSEQDPSKKEEIDAHVASWSLTQIRLPSGGRIVVDYESDDYAYVQHKPAMQMIEFVDPYRDPTGTLMPNYVLSDSDFKIRFRLEKQLAGDASLAMQQAEVKKYFATKSKQLYFKTLINLRSSRENFYEYISGYADVDFSKAMGLEKDASGKYAYGFFYLAKEKGHHPLSLRAWQHIRTNQPDLAGSGIELKQTDSQKERISQIKSLSGFGARIRQMFEGFFNYCRNKGWGRQVDGTRSWVRLNSPDKIKYGGGLRVRQVTLTDQWAQDEEGIYGQVYEYTTDEGGSIISSGVAAYEPLIGGDENALRYAKKFTQSAPLRSDNNMFFEYPINETYFPAPQVGYSKVTVTSLSAASLAGKKVKNVTLQDGKTLFPQGLNKSFGTTGMIVHEFYTAKDFPVITDETEKANKSFKLSILVPFIGGLTVTKLAASQGYSIITNDMHGKQKQISSYRQDKTGRIEPKPISWVKYNYRDQKLLYQQEKVSSLVNVFKDNGDGTLSILSPGDNVSIPKFTLGQENEFFIDMRKFQDKSWTGGVRVNTDIVIIFFPIPIGVPWPSATKTINELRSSSTNKVIFKSGILESTEAYDGGSHLITKNVKWDKLTGQPLLTVVNNNFDAPVYSYSVPAYREYQGMGAAYQNLGLTFTMSNVQKDPYQNNLYRFTTVVANDLFPGDEILLYPSGAEIANPIAHVVYTGEDDELTLRSTKSLTATSYNAMIVRSGYRNQVGVTAGTITALADPSTPGTPVTHNKVISIPLEK